MDVHGVWALSMSILSSLLGNVNLTNGQYGELYADSGWPQNYTFDILCQRNETSDVLIATCSSDDVVTGIIIGGYDSENGPDVCYVEETHCFGFCGTLMDTLVKRCLFKEATCGPFSKDLLGFRLHFCPPAATCHYLFVNYTCTPADHIYHACSNRTDVNTTWAYILSPNYPGAFEISDHTCEPTTVFLPTEKHVLCILVTDVRFSGCERTFVTLTHRHVTCDPDCEWCTQTIGEKICRSDDRGLDLSVAGPGYVLFTLTSTAASEVGHGFQIKLHVEYNSTRQPTVDPPPVCHETTSQAITSDDVISVTSTSGFSSTTQRDPTTPTEWEVWKTVLLVILSLVLCIFVALLIYRFCRRKRNKWSLDNSTTCQDSNEYYVNNIGENRSSTSFESGSNAQTKITILDAESVYYENQKSNLNHVCNGVINNGYVSHYKTNCLDQQETRATPALDSHSELPGIPRKHSNAEEPRISTSKCKNYSEKSGTSKNHTSSSGCSEHPEVSHRHTGSCDSGTSLNTSSPDQTGAPNSHNYSEQKPQSKTMTSIEEPSTSKNQRQFEEPIAAHNNEVETESWISLPL